MEFKPSDSKTLERFKVLMIDGKGVKTFYRITHIFDSSLFMLTVSTPQKAHDANRPRAFRRSTVQRMIDAGEARLGWIGLPGELASYWPPDSAEANDCEAAWKVIEPLVTVFDTEANLDRSFNGRIAMRAQSLGMPSQTVRRILLRYWYFGGVKHCLLPLRTGPKPHSAVAAAGSIETEGVKAQGKRRGRRPANADRLTPSEWTPDDTDIDDMEAAARRCAALNLSTLTQLHREYLQVEFRKRHREEYSRYKAGEITEPCTARQVGYRLRNRSELSAAVRAAFPSLATGGPERALRSEGPGDVYELDATGGQIVIVDSQDPTHVLKKLTIYLLIDRWSRYVVSVYITLRPPSAEAVRQTMRIAFTSRTSRFKFLNAQVDDRRWPPAVIPAQLAVDNGPDIIAKASVALAVEDLRIECVVLPPYTPDGKAIIERVNKTLKQRMRERGLPGIYSKFTTDPLDKRSKKRQLLTSCLSLQEVYRELVEIVIEYNNAPHDGLRKSLPQLAQHRIANTPQAAFEWGLVHISGRDRGALAPEDYERLTLQTVDATLRQGVVTLKGGYRFFPANEAATRIALDSNSKAREIKVKIDKTDPAFLWVVTNEDSWPRWKLDDAGCLRLAAQSLEEREEYEDLHRADRTDTRMAATRNTLPEADAPFEQRKQRRTVKSPQSDAEVRLRSDRESEALDRGLEGLAGMKRPATAPKPAFKPKAVMTAAQFDADELESIAKRQANRSR